MTKKKKAERVVTRSSKTIWAGNMTVKKNGVKKKFYWL